MYFVPSIKELKLINRIIKKCFKKHKIIAICIKILICFIIIILGIYFLNFGFDSVLFSDNKGDWGTFGDYMGGVLNPILAFMSFMALLYTIKLQRDELAATRKELARSAKAQENSEKALAEQSQIFQQQQFESTFFSLLEQINKVANKLESEFSSKNNEIYKKMNNEYYYNNKNGISTKYIIDYHSYSNYVDYGSAENIFHDFKTSIHNDLPQFKSFSLLIFQMLKMINSLTEESLKKDYADILKASLHINLLQLLAIYADDIGKFSDENRKLIRKFRLLEHMLFNFNDTKFNKRGHVVLFHLINKYRLDNEENAFEGNYYLAYLEEE